MVYGDIVEQPAASPGIGFGSRYRWAILGLAFVSQFTATLAAQIVPPLAPIFQAELGLSKLEIGFFSSAAFVGSWMVLLVAGYLTERFGVRRLMSLGQVVAGSVMLTMAFAGSFLQALLVMFVVGLCRGMVHPGASKAIMDWFPARERATAMGVKQSGYPVAGMLLGVILPALALTLGWRYAVALVGLLIISGGILTVAFYRDPNRELVASRSGLSMRQGLRELIRNRRLWALSVTALLLVSAQLALVAYLALYFSDIVLVPLFPDANARIIAAGGFSGAPAGGWNYGEGRLGTGERPLLARAQTALDGSSRGSLRGHGPGDGDDRSGIPFWLLAVVVFVYGGSALGWNGLFQALIVETAGKKHAAMAVGLCMTMTQIGTISGPPLFGLVVDLTGAYQIAWLCVASLSLGGALLGGACSLGELRATRARASIASR